MADTPSSTTSRHYDSWAKANTNSWVLSDAYFDFWSNRVVRYLALSSKDRVCDVGAGTGRLAKAIHDKSGASVVCVEPTPSLVEIIRSHGLEAVQQSGENFVREAPSCSFDKMLIKQAIHHMSGRPRLQVCHDFHRILRPRGIGLILTMPSTIPYPMFAAARQRFEQFQIDIKGLKLDLERAGFTTSEDKEDFPVKITRDFFFQAIRARFISDLAGFSAEEIEQGIEEIRSAYGDPEVYEFGDRLHLLKFCVS